MAQEAEVQRHGGVSMRGIGLVFDIDELGGGYYGDKAWRIFMRNLRPNTITGCALREGDTDETLSGAAREFCIAVLGPGLDADVIKRTFETCPEKGLVPSTRRFRATPGLSSEPLVDAGVIDSMGRLVQDEWTRVVHDQCKDSGWGFAPKSVPGDLPPNLTAELNELRGKTLTPPGRPNPGQSSIPSPSGARKRAWWKFWAE